MGDRTGVRGILPSNPALPHTPIKVGPEHARRPKVKGRRDIYDLAEDDAGFTAALNKNTPAANTSYAEPVTSSFWYPDSPSPKSQESRTIKKCLTIARKAPQIAPNQASKTPSQNPIEAGSGATITEKLNREAQGLSLSPEQ
jgi:hypothetical protein